jgi:thiosulfate dehydrogenase [quinone] large subunit
MPASSTALAYGLLRLTLGVNFLMHGLTRILKGVSEFAEKIVAQFAETPLPPALVSAYATGLTYVEFGVGLLILLGLFTREALVVGALVMVSLIFGTSLRQDWGTVGTQMIYALFFFLLLHFLENNRYSLDHLRQRR